MWVIIYSIAFHIFGLLWYCLYRVESSIRLWLSKIDTLMMMMMKQTNKQSINQSFIMLYIFFGIFELYFKYNFAIEVLLTQQ